MQLSADTSLLKGQSSASWKDLDMHALLLVMAINAAGPMDTVVRGVSHCRLLIDDGTSKGR
jgi:hypothetical protein